MPWPRRQDPSVTDWVGLSSTPNEGAALARLWRGFMAARAFVAAMLVILHALAYSIGSVSLLTSLPLSALYLFVTLASWRYTHFRAALRNFGGVWLITVGLDLAMFSLLQVQQSGNINYIPLFVLPVLMASVLGRMMVGLGTTAIVTLLLLADAVWRSQGNSASDMAPRLAQAALTGTGLFVVALLANELARRLAREETLAVRSRSTARMHAQVSDLVIETLSEGVLVIDASGRVHSANPAANLILGMRLGQLPLPFALEAYPAWRPLAELAQQTFTQQSSQITEISVAQPEGAPCEVRVRTRLTHAGDPRVLSLCVMFLQDLRELEARIRTEKLAAMGRMSAAVAHEIRNPLAAIAQASALLAEDIEEPGQRKLTTMIEQNAQRLARIVDDVLDVSRARQQRALPLDGEIIMLDATVRTIAEEWVQHSGRQGVLLLPSAPESQVRFDTEHLRRILVNLLDNAARYADQREGSIQLATFVAEGGHATLQVWSDGAPLDPAVQRHLFEPFFSSESRSSGLGLFICRELCERHGATIGYERHRLASMGVEGNAFVMSFST